MKKNCTQCSASYEITKDDLAFYAKLSPVIAGKRYDIPSPTLCPACRDQNRLAFRNEWNFYHRKCDLTGKQMISVYSPDKPYTVYEQSVWWSDQYDPLAYGRDFDFNRPFFEQWQELSLAVPRLSIHNAKSENCEYTNYSAENKNCYMTVGALGCEDNYYSYRPTYCKNICDCYDPFECELCYEVSSSKKLYDCQHCMQCINSSGLRYCSFCNGCTESFGCINLRNKKFCIFNVPYAQEEYRKKISELQGDMTAAREQYEALRLSESHQALDVINCEASTGDHLLNCKNCQDVFVFKDSQDCRYFMFGENNTTCMDCNHGDNCELQYFSANLEKNYNVLFANLAWYVKDSMYVTSSFHSSHLFGCIGMKKHQYCILNKQYTKEEYESLLPKIIEHMQSSGEWSSYYPVENSPFGYNESVAQEYYPMTKEEACVCGWKWYEEEAKKDQYLGPPYSIPTEISQVSDDITKQILTCEVTGKPYKIIPQELALYRQMNIPIPRKCPTERHRERSALRNPRKFWNRECAKCQKPIATSYSPDRPERVYCEECYLKEVY